MQISAAMQFQNSRGYIVLKNLYLNNVVYVHCTCIPGNVLFSLMLQTGDSYSQDSAWNGLRTVERYSITEGCWEAAWEMAESRQGMTAFTL